LSGTGKQLWLIVSERGCSDNAEKKLALENAGVKIIPIKEEEANGKNLQKKDTSVLIANFSRKKKKKKRKKRKHSFNKSIRNIKTPRHRHVDG
jgi:hypothetical protein